MVGNFVMNTLKIKAFCFTMRKITRDAHYAFMNRQNFKRDNTEVRQHDEVSASLYLHGNEIAWMDANGIFINHCGWATSTTKERLNNLCGITIHQHDFQWFVDGKRWDGSTLRIGN
jgi:hypothetical protein